jgi:hypothetical protein
MAVKLIDLQVIYGVAGAREKFERLVAKLVKAEHPHAEAIRIKRGDDGIDVYVGRFSDPSGIDVFQCKYFWQGVGPSQQKQIRQSFTRVLKSKKFKARTWTLCLPLDLTIDEQAWFETWKAKQASKGITIEAPWTALKLESLLCQEKNRGLKETYFKEAHLTQIREMHGMMQDLIASLAHRLQEETASRDETKKLGALERQAQYVQKFVSSLRDEFIPLVRLKFADAEKQPVQWEVVIRPSWLHDQPWIKSLAACWSALEACQVGPVQMRYPNTTYVRKDNRQDYISGTLATDIEVDCLRFSQKCVFSHMFTVLEDPAFKPGTFVAGDTLIARLTQMFRFAKGLAEKVFDPNDGSVEMTMRLKAIHNRILALLGAFRRGSTCASESELECVQTCNREELLADPDALAIKAAIWFFERFNWQHSAEGALKRIQSDFLRNL